LCAIYGSSYWKDTLHLSLNKFGTFLPFLFTTTVWFEIDLRFLCCLFSL
jgi:hypothetical protein